ncbi:MAG: oligosaccharide flippase family protein [Pirellulales bacterium]|nr:oligosaccharide flippase family protein [Pirellulales bacterium]
MSQTNPPVDRPAGASQPADAALKRLARGGTFAATAAGWIGQVAHVALYALLYRLLVPEVFGQFWMVLPWVLLLRAVSTGGLNIGAVQRAQLSDGQTSTLFWLMVLGGVITTVVTAALGPLLAWSKSQPELLGLTLALSGTALLSAAAAAHQALVERRMRLGALAVARLVCQIAGGAAAVTLAWLGCGVWSLVGQTYVELGLLAALSWWLEPWRPRVPWRGEPVGDLLRFGGYYTIAMLLFSIAQLSDKLLLSLLLDVRAAESALGYYSQAFAWMMKPVLLVTTPLTAAALPALSRAAGSTPVYRDLLLAFNRLIAIFLFPSGVGLAIVAPETMVILGGANWEPAGVLLRVLAVVILAQGFINLVGSILVSVGRADRLCLGALVLAVVAALGSFIGLSLGQVIENPSLGLAIGYATAVAGVFFLPYLAFALRTAGIPSRDWFATLRPAATSSAAMGIIVIAARWALTHAALPPAAAFAIEIALGVVAYALFARGEIMWLRGQLGQLRRGSPEV